MTTAPALTCRVLLADENLLRRISMEALIQEGMGLEAIVCHSLEMATAHLGYRLAFVSRTLWDYEDRRFGMVTTWDFARRLRDKGMEVHVMTSLDPETLPPELAGLAFFDWMSDDAIREIVHRACASD